MTNLAASFKERDGMIYHGLALVYAVTMYILGILGLFQSSWLLNFLATLCLAHGMTIAAYRFTKPGITQFFEIIRIMPESEKS